MHLFSFGLSRRQQRFSFSSFLDSLVFITLTVMITSGCKKNDSAPPPILPSITTAALTNITTSSATAGGNIINDGGAAITQSGIVWSKTNATPTLADSVVVSTTTSGSFTSNLIGLDFNRIYYIRAYAINSVGTGYGDVVTLNTANDTTKVRFTYNGEEVIYSVIISPITGRKWLDRDLGAGRVATANNDYQAYGDIFQWGRPADGHQLINWTADNANYPGPGPSPVTPVNGISTVVATSDTPGHNNFIMPPYALPLDWRSVNTGNRWTTSPQGPCPVGWHVPTIEEWMKETGLTSQGGTTGGFTGINGAYSQLKLTVAGIRLVDGPGSVNFYQVGNSCYYWSTSEEIINGVTGATAIEIGPAGAGPAGAYKSTACSVRCLKN